MTVNDFLDWIDGREGRWELFDGALVEKRPERPEHTQTKREAAETLKSAIRKAGAPCHVVKDGAIVRISEQTAFEPDGVVYYGPRAERDTVEVLAPVVVVEVLSDGTAERDLGPKLAGYFSLPTVAHYLVLDPEKRTVLHHWRGEEGVESREVSEGPLRLDPPGLAFFAEGLFSPG